MAQLSNPSRIGSILMPHASADGPVRVSFSPEESRYFKSRAGTYRLIEQRFRGIITISWAALSYDLAAALLRELQSSPVEVVPRTRGKDDPAYIEEVHLQCRVTSELPTTAELRRGTFPIEAEMETLRTYDEVPGIGTPPPVSIEHGEHVDLFGGLQQQALSTGAQGWREDVRTYAGRLLRLTPRESGALTVRLLDAGGTLIVETQGSPSGGDDVYVELQEATHTIEVETASGERPVMRLDPDDFLFALVSEDAQTAQVSLAGRGKETEGTLGLTSPMTGETIQCDTYSLGKGLLPQGRILAETDRTVTLLLDD